MDGGARCDLYISFVDLMYLLWSWLRSDSDLTGSIQKRYLELGLTLRSRHTVSNFSEPELNKPILAPVLSSGDE